MIKVKDILSYINSFAPFDTQPQWDNSGLLVGDENSEVNKVAFCLDLTSETLAQALEERADLIVTHHPLIFTAKKRLLKGDVVFDVITSGINVISCHIPFDCAFGGVNDELCKILEIENTTVCEDNGILRIGDIKEMASLDFARFVSKKLGAVCDMVDCDNIIRRVAVCGGSGMDFLNDAVANSADAFVTGEIKHHEAIEAKEKGITVIAAGHFETENPSKYAMEKFIKNNFSGLKTVILNQSNPLKVVDER